MTKELEVVTAEILEPVDPVETPKLYMTKEKELEIFKSLAFKSYKQVGYDSGLHLIYKTDPKVRAAVMNIARKVRKAPELYGISEDAVKIVDEAAASRSIKQNPAIRSAVAIQQESFKDKLDNMRDSVAELIMEKLKGYGKKGGIDQVTLRDLKDLLAVAIDKGRLLRGESTDNIVKYNKLDTENMTPQEALDVVMKARDAMIEARGN